MSVREQRGHVTDEELAEVERLCANMGEDTFAEPARSHAALAEMGLTLLPRACCELRALRAPVNVEAEANMIAGKVLDAYRSEGNFGAAIEAVRPHVERAAVLAREAEGLRERCASLSVRLSLDSEAKLRADLATASAEVERLKAISDAWKALAKARGRRSDVDIARAAKDTLRDLGIDPDAP